MMARCYVFDYYKDPPQYSLSTTNEVVSFGSQSHTMGSINWVFHAGVYGPHCYICHQDAPLEGKVKKCITLFPLMLTLDDVGIHMYGSTDEVAYGLSRKTNTG